VDETLSLVRLFIEHEFLETFNFPFETISRFMNQPLLTGCDLPKVVGWREHKAKDLAAFVVRETKNVELPVKNEQSWYPLDWSLGYGG